MFYCPKCLTRDEKVFLEIMIIEEYSVISVSEDRKDGVLVLLTTSPAKKVVKYKVDIKCPKECMGNFYQLKRDAIVTKIKNKFEISLPGYDRLVEEEQRFSTKNYALGAPQFKANDYFKDENWRRSWIMGYHSPASNPEEVPKNLELIRYSEEPEEDIFNYEYS